MTLAWLVVGILICWMGWEIERLERATTPLGVAKRGYRVVAILLLAACCMMTFKAAIYRAELRGLIVGCR